MANYYSEQYSLMRAPTIPLEPQESLSVQEDQKEIVPMKLSIVDYVLVDGQKC